MTLNQHRITTRGLFITGTDTDVGKTYITSLIARHLKQQGFAVGVYKPACSGATFDEEGEATWADLTELDAAIQPHPFPIECICPQRFEAALAPPVAARLENREVDDALLDRGIDYWQDKVDILLIEGVGGLLCPLTSRKTVGDWAAAVGYPTLIVGRLGLGTINHTLMTIEAAECRGLEIAGVVLNQSTSDQIGYDSETNPDEISSRCRYPLLGVCPFGEKNNLRQGTAPVKIDWASMAAIPGIT